MVRFFLILLVTHVCGGLPAVQAAGSLYNEKSFQSLTADRRAHQVGDSLTILVFEAASATASADTQAEQSGGVSVGLSTHKRDQSAKLTLSDDSTGKGKIQRSGKLAAQITVTVQSVARNGDLHVSGRQLIAVNDEKQEITLKGRVRPQDIAENNTVVSSRVADASISYVGHGLLAEKQKPGIITRLLSWLGLL